MMLYTKLIHLIRHSIGVVPDVLIGIVTSHMLVHIVENLKSASGCTYSKTMISK